jgi:hypothetical protein
MSMENLVLSSGGEGRREASAGTVGPSLAAVWVVAWMGMLTALANLRSLEVVVTLGRGGSARWMVTGSEGLEGLEGAVHAVEFVDGCAELFLQVADAVVVNNEVTCDTELEVWTYRMAGFSARGC